MKVKHLVTATAAAAMTLGLASSALAGDAGETANLFRSAGAKQSAEDFKPAPERIETSSGTLEFELGAFPTEETVRRIYDEMDLHRARLHDHGAVAFVWSVGDRYVCRNRDDNAGHIYDFHSRGR